MNRALTALGLSIPRSADAIHAAVLVTDGVSVSVLGPTLAHPLGGAARADIEAARAIAVAGRHDPRALQLADMAITAAAVDLVRDLFAATGLQAREIDILGFEPLLLRHDVAGRRLVEAGDAATLRQAFEIATVAGFRRSDLENGGYGSGQAATYHATLAVRADLARPVAIVDLDRVTSMTVVGTEGFTDVVAAEIGPGPSAFPAIARDLAGRGGIDDAALEMLLQNGFFDHLPPKACDEADMPLPADVSALTAAAMIGEAVAFACDLLVDRPGTLVPVGPGASNPVVLDALATRTNALIVAAESLDWSAEFMSAQAVAFAAVRHRNGLATSYPGTSGVPRPTVGGSDVTE